MGIEMEGQTKEEYREIKTRELQMENMDKLNTVTDMVDNINIDGIESDTKVIKEMVFNNLETQANLDDVLNSINKVAQGISDIKRSQTNLNKKINELQDKIGD